MGGFKIVRAIAVSEVEPVWVLVVSGLILLRAGVFDAHRDSITT